MRNPTELMRAILTNELAQKIIDYVSPIYGNSYVGLWIYQAIGTALSDVYKLGYDLKQETNPLTSTLLMDYWEAHYGLTKESSLTMEQRRNRIMAKVKSRGSCNPARLAEAVSVAMGGVKVDITENVGKNRFLVTIREDVETIEPAIAVIERMKPAHLIYDIHVELLATPTGSVKTAVAMTYAEKYILNAVEPELPPSVIYVDGETLVAYSENVQTTRESVVITNGIATVAGETLTIGGV